MGGRRSAAGFTLAELLVVLSVIAVLAALSIAALLRLPARYEREQLLTSVRALVDRARAAAIEGGGAWLWRDRRRLVAAVWTPLVLLHGEELERGSDDDAVAVRGAHGLVAGGRGIEAGPGRFGAALYFTAPGAFLDLGNAPSYSPPVGLRIALWLLPGPPEQRPLTPRPGSLEDDPDAIVRYPILEKRGEYGLYLCEDGAIEAQIVGREGERRWRVRTPAGSVQPGRWVELRWECDGRRSRLWLDGLRADTEQAGGGPLPLARPGDAPLLVSSPDPARSLFAAIDELRLDGAFGQNAVEIPEGFELEGPARVVFDRFGALDPFEHDAPVRFVLWALAPPGESGLETGPRTVRASAAAASTDDGRERIGVVELLPSGWVR